ncbi:MAG: PHP domain-containing protein, partial [Candidatus Ranarchaeia archaeon]
MYKIDIHMHTWYSSDGVHTPTEMVKAAAECGLHAIAITDHDNVKGHREAMAAGHRFGVIVIPGIEISTSEGHLLGLGV